MTCVECVWVGLEWVVPSFSSLVSVGGGNGGSNFFFNDTATTEIYTLSLRDALPILVTGLAHN